MSKDDLIKLVEKVSAKSEQTKQVITYVHQYEKDYYYGVFGDSVEYMQLPEKVALK